MAVNFKITLFVAYVNRRNNPYHSVKAVTCAAYLHRLRRNILLAECVIVGRQAYNNGFNRHGAFAYFIKININIIRVNFYNLPFRELGMHRQILLPHVAPVAVDIGNNFFFRYAAQKAALAAYLNFNVIGRIKYNHVFGNVALLQLNHKIALNYRVLLAHNIQPQSAGHYQGDDTRN